MIHLLLRSERVFSSAGLIVDDKRTNLESNLVIALVLLKMSWEYVSGWVNTHNN